MFELSDQGLLLPTVELNCEYLHFTGVLDFLRQCFFLSFFSVFIPSTLVPDLSFDADYQLYSI